MRTIGCVLMAAFMVGCTGLTDRLPRPSDDRDPGGSSQGSDGREYERFVLRSGVSRRYHELPPIVPFVPGRILLPLGWTDNSTAVLRVDGPAQYLDVRVVTEGGVRVGEDSTPMNGIWVSEEESEWDLVIEPVFEGNASVRLEWRPMNNETVVWQPSGAREAYYVYQPTK